SRAEPGSGSHSSRDGQKIQKMNAKWLQNGRHPADWEVLMHQGRHFLQIPGPSPVPDRILRAMDRKYKK
ncbi:hypothetical protein, partial [Escherichia coli]|uniref:hypothetical protein n=1 Tax=Escherichia coli TaxID=562 RepID=UPI001BC8912D